MLIMTEIQFSPQAISDLQEVKACIIEELYNEQAAINTIAMIMKIIRMLVDFPESGASLSSIIGFETDYCFLVCGNYTTFYRVEDTTVYIVRVLYGRRNFMQILFGVPQDEN